MKDSIVRGRVLQLLCQRRDEGPLPFGAVEGAVEPPAGIDVRAWLHAVAQLAEYGLVTWKPPADESATSAMSGVAEITEKGVDVHDGRETPDIDIRFC
ncbi:MAG: hypothetical protein ACR2FX_06930 [Chthoniobacterales bacterium]